MGDTVSTKPPVPLDDAFRIIRIGFLADQNDRFFIARPGDIVIIGKDQLHSTYTYEDSNCDILVIMFDAANIFEQNINGSEQNPLSVYGNSVVYNNPVQSSGEPGKSVLDCITGIHEELTQKRCAYPMIIKSLLYKMSGLFTRNGLYEVANHDIKSIKIARQMLSKTFALIDDHYFSEISQHGHGCSIGF